LNRLVFALTPLLALLACSSADPGAAAGGAAGRGGGGQEPAGGAAGAAGQAGDAGQGAAAGSGGACAGATVLSASGEVTSEDGAPLSGLIAQLCLDFVDGGLCFAGKPVPADGHYTLSADPGIPCVTRSSVRLASITPRRSSSYCAASGEGGSLSVGPSVVYAVPPAATLPPAGTTAEERLVTFEDGLEIRVIPDNFFPEIGSYEDLGARWVDPAGAGLCFLGGAPALDGLYAFWPEGDVRGGFPFRVPNRRHLAPGTGVTFFALGGLLCSLSDDTKIPEGQLASFGRGRVDEAGAFLVPEAGVQAPCLTWLGYAADAP
jgi:hypothetical protein